MARSRCLNSSLDRECHIGSVVHIDTEGQIAQFNPAQIKHELRVVGFEIECREATEAEPQAESLDNDMRVVQRFLRAFSPVECIKRINDPPATWCELEPFHQITDAAIGRGGRREERVVPRSR